MSNGPNSLLDLKSITSQQIQDIFSETTQLKKSKPKPQLSGERIALLFFEPSTRTRMSFESAAIRCGMGPLVFDGGPNTSLEKGETVEDSILNVAAMEPALMVIRCQDTVPLDLIAKKLNMPVLNAGWGMRGHPTQALLDTYTMQEELGPLEGVRLLILGDVKHSRVAASHFELLPKLGVKIGICGPPEFLVSRNGVEVFTSLEAGLRWAQVAMALRVQFERHDGGSGLSRELYRKSFGLNSASLQSFSAHGILMHPGPINHGIEMETEVLSDSRSKVLKQVTNGVYIREALLRRMYVG